jgi:putative spermidine/putrescine transport system substrate-binding protein
LLVKFAELNDGGIENIDPGFAALSKIAPGVIEWTDTWGQMGVHLQSEAAALGTYGYARAKAMRDKGIPVDVIIPKGSYFNPFGAGIMKNAPNSEGATVLLNWLLGKTFQSYRAKEYGDIVMNKETETPEGAPGPKEIEGFVMLPFEKVVDKWPEWARRFQREIESRQ